MSIRAILLFLVGLGALGACRKGHGGISDTGNPSKYDSTPSPFMQRTVVELDAYHKDSAWLQLPVHYNSGFDTEKYPLVVFMNGRGEASDRGNLGRLVEWGVPHFMADSIRFSFDVAGKKQGMIMICPQSANGYPSPFAINQIINYMTARYRVDASRIYLTGLSSGAAAVFSYLTYSKEFASRIAAAAPMSAIELETEKIANLKYVSEAGTHVQVYCGKSDYLYLKNKSYVDEINKYTPGLAVFTAYGGVHGSWNPRYNPSHDYYNPNVYEWMLQYHR